MNNEVSAKGLEAILKSADTEEWIDLLFYRPIGIVGLFCFVIWELLLTLSP